MLLVIAGIVVGITCGYFASYTVTYLRLIWEAERITYDSHRSSS